MENFPNNLIHFEQQKLTPFVNWFYQSGRVDFAQEIHKRVTLENFRRADAAGLVDEKKIFSRQAGTAIGHIGLIDFIVKNEILCNRNPRNLVIVRSQSCKNLKILDLWKRYCEIVDEKSDFYPNIFIQSNEIFFEGWIDKTTKKYISNYKCQAYKKIQNRWDNESRKPLLKVPKNVIKNGKEFLKSRGLHPRFITIHIKESGPLHSTGRFSHLVKLKSTIEYILSNKFSVIILGEKTSEEFSDKNLLYFCNEKDQDDNLNIFFLGHCKLFIGNTSGPASIPPCFGTPCLLIDWWPSGYFQPYKNCKTLFKKAFNIFLKSEQRQTEINYIESKQALFENGVYLRDNSAEEIYKFFLLNKNILAV
jgi:putative glycosyltransferase (TIGR04372 family)